MRERKLAQKHEATACVVEVAFSGLRIQILAVIVGEKMPESCVDEA